MDTSASLYFAVLIMVTSCHADMSVVDLTYTLDNETVNWPTNPPFKFNVISRQNTSGGYWYESNSVFLPEHMGTHVDAPAHFYQGNWRVEHIPASHLIRPAVVVDVRDKVLNDNDYRITKQDLLDWEADYDTILKGSIVIFNTGWGSRYQDPARVFNTPDPTDPSATFHFPGIHPEAATFLAEKRQPVAVGVDTPSMDYGMSKDFQTHVIFGKHNVIGLENLANVSRLPARGATVVIGLVKLRDGSGGPARILGLLNLPTGRAAGVNANGSILAILLLCFMLLAGC